MPSIAKRNTQSPMGYQDTVFNSDNAMAKASSMTNNFQSGVKPLQTEIELSQSKDTS